MKQWTINELYKRFDHTKNIDVLLPEILHEAKSRFNFLMNHLSAFLEYLQIADPEVKCALFYLLHESGAHLIQADDWDDFRNLAVLFKRWIEKFYDLTAPVEKELQFIGWTSAADPLETDPMTGRFAEVSIRKNIEDLLTIARAQIPEFIALKQLENISEAERTETYISNYQAARKAVQGISIQLEYVMDSKGNIRFVEAVVKKPTKLQPERIPVYTTLYHKRRNAWDAWRMLGAEATGILAPDQWITREDTMRYLHRLHETILSRALEKLVATAQQYQSVSRTAG